MKRTEFGTIYADDDDFCSIAIGVVQMDDGRERDVRDQFVLHEPVRVHMGWEQNCSSRPGIWLTPDEARALAALLIQAADRPVGAS